MNEYAQPVTVDVDALIRNIEDRIDRAAMGASVGQLSGSPVSEAVAWELGSLLVDVTEQRGKGTVDWYASGEDQGVIQRAHVACCWCGDHHEEGR